MICAISPLASATPEEILRAITKFPGALIVLPGLFPNTPSASAISRILPPDTRVFSEHFGDPDNAHPILIDRDGIQSLPKQVFVSNPSKGSILRLQSIWEDRTITHCRRRVTFCLCGEINAYNPDGSVKWDIPLPIDDILINPAHYLMPRWNYLGEKLRNLSANKTVIHTANNILNHHNTLRDLRIYSNLTLNRQKQIEGKISWLIFKG